MNAPVHFKQQLAQELTVRANALAPQSGLRVRGRVPRRRLTLSLGAVAAAVAVAVAVPLLGGVQGEQAEGTSAAPSLQTKAGNLDIVTADYAVKSVPDGTVAVKVMSRRGIPGLQDALRQAGIPASVMTFSASCHTKVLYDGGVDSMKVFPQGTAGSGIDGHYSLIKPNAVPAGDHLLFVPTTGAQGQIGTLQMSVVRQVPSCVPESDNGIGAGYVPPGTNP
ncbi:hypothetical protein [Streptomyces sp. NBC_00083]|uniref:hypothetical protein n=1 Tax=Streptomyces sp. NBC_00083 TaxID=2975647 RepID=UPI002253AB6B|nr:hypothetical protein [Streptomyces sp. NBC_00083]MCX5384507.1 hypothetical protein [Streptomyces sp. NBC_00083]